MIKQATARKTRNVVPFRGKVSKEQTPFFALEADIRDVHSMVQLTAMAVDAGEDGLTVFGIYEVEKMTEALMRRYADLHKKHVEQQSA
jgi:hypothetical protein